MSPRKALTARQAAVLAYIREHPGCSGGEVWWDINNSLEWGHWDYALEQLRVQGLIYRTGQYRSGFRYEAVAGSSSGKAPGLGPGERGSSPRPATKTKEGER